MKKWIEIGKEIIFLELTLTRYAFHLFERIVGMNQN